MFIRVRDHIIKLIARLSLNLFKKGIKRYTAIDETYGESTINRQTLELVYLHWKSQSDIEINNSQRSKLHRAHTTHMQRG